MFFGFVRVFLGMSVLLCVCVPTLMYVPVRACVCVCVLEIFDRASRLIMLHCFWWRRTKPLWLLWLWKREKTDPDLGYSCFTVGVSPPPSPIQTYKRHLWTIQQACFVLTKVSQISCLDWNRGNTHSWSVCNTHGCSKLEASLRFQTNLKYYV